MTSFFSWIFAEAHGVDTSEEMINLARNWTKDRTSLYFNVGNGFDLRIYEDSQFDFVFSQVVFQHIPKKEIIKSYIHEIDRVLRPGGLFQVQFDNRVWYHALGFIPVHRLLVNWLLETKFIRFYYNFARFLGKPNFTGVLLSSKELNEMLEDTSLEVVETLGDATAFMWCMGRRRN